MRFSIARSMPSDELRKNILSTYFHLRVGLVVLSFVFPLLLYFGGLWWGHVNHLAESMSAYYNESGGGMRNWFVGILWAIGWFLFLYRGFSPLERWLLNLAGFFAVVVAMRPCQCWDGSDTSDAIHVTSAVLFFLCVAAVCFFCAEQTVTLLPVKDQPAFKARYRAISAALIASPVVAISVSVWFRALDQYKFFIEMFGVWVFAYYWWTKSREFKITSAEKLALHGMLENKKGVGLQKVGVAPSVAALAGP
jgi:hypothetical protein